MISITVWLVADFRRHLPDFTPQTKMAGTKLVLGKLGSRVPTLRVVASLRCFSTQTTLDEELSRLKIQLREHKKDKAKLDEMYPTEEKLPETKTLEELLSKPDPEFDGILDINNPPKLKHEHYGLLRRILGPKLNTSAEEVERRARNAEDPDNPIYWDEARWTTMLRAGNELLPLDPLYSFDILNREDLTVDPAEISKLDNHPHWGPPKLRVRSRTCRLCKPDNTSGLKNTLDYTNVNFLLTFVNAKGMITPRKTNGNCARHQRQLARTVKRARRIGLMSTVSNWRVPFFFWKQLYGDNNERKPELIKKYGIGKHVGANAYDDEILARMVGDKEPFRAKEKRDETVSMGSLEEEDAKLLAEVSEEKQEDDDQNSEDYFGLITARLSGREFSSQQEREQAFDQEIVKLLEENSFKHEEALEMLAEFKRQLAEEETQAAKGGRQLLSEWMEENAGDEEVEKDGEDEESSKK
eukprot:g63719.t1